MLLPETPAGINLSWEVISNQIALNAPEIATFLALVSAIGHAAFGALQKGKYNPWMVRGAMDFFYFIMSLPIAIFLVPRPNWSDLGLLFGALFIHTIYKVFNLMAYTRADYTAVYPVVRGISPIATVILVFFIFEEIFSLVQWMGVLVLSVSIVLLGANDIINNKSDRFSMLAALFFAFITGIFVAFYTVYDAYAVRAIDNPFTFIIWLFVLDGIIIPICCFLYWQNLVGKFTLVPLLPLGVSGAFLAYLSFGSLMIASRIDNVGQAAVLRETSVIFALFFGWFFLGEKVGLVKVILILFIALGAFLVKIGT